MRSPLTLLLTIPATLAACDAGMRAVLWLFAKRAKPAQGGSLSTLIVVPARGEGARLEGTLASASGRDVLLLLDGEDPAIEELARTNGVKVVVKMPGGPSKAAALQWLVREHRALLEPYACVMILDAGSRLTPEFALQWPDDASALQTYLQGSSDGVGAAASASEQFAQGAEDRGREALGWNVRLRGSGSAFRTQTFLELMPRLGTRVEDLEATLLMTADDAKIRMTDASLLDDKPTAVRAAASQRSRWLVGRYELLVRRAPAFAKAIARHPLEGLAFFVEIFGRPLSLTVPLRLGAAVLLARRHPVWCGTLAVSAAADIALHAAAYKQSPRAVLRLAGSWVMALLLAPRAVVRWMRP